MKPRPRAIGFLLVPALLWGCAAAPKPPQAQAAPPLVAQPAVAPLVAQPAANKIGHTPTEPSLPQQTLRQPTNGGLKTAAKAPIQRREPPRKTPPAATARPQQPLVAEHRPQPVPAGPSSAKASENTSPPEPSEQVASAPPPPARPQAPPPRQPLTPSQPPRPAPPGFQLPEPDYPQAQAPRAPAPTASAATTGDGTRASDSEESELLFMLDDSAAYPTYHPGVIIDGWQDERWLTVRFDLQPNGRFRVTLLEGTGDPALDLLALDILRQWTWQPKTVAGRPTPSTEILQLKRNVSRAP